MKKETFRFDIPSGIVARGDVKLWGWSPDYIGVIGVCVERHEEWTEDDQAYVMYERSGVQEPQKIACVPWHELDDDLIVECQSQVFAFNDVSRAAEGCMALLYSGEVGTIRKVEFRLATEEERLTNLRDELPISFIACEVEIETDKKYYTNVREYDIRHVDNVKALMPSMELRSLQRSIRKDLYAEKNKIVSMEEWKKKKGLIPSEGNANENGV